MRSLGVFLSLLLMSAVFAGCFGESEDEDGLTREVEEEGYVITIEDAEGERTQRRVTSSPFEPDLDEDGLDDMQERLEQTDPRSPDTDGDGLLDGSDVPVSSGDARIERWLELGVVHQRTAEGNHIFYGERGGDTVAHGGDPKDADTDDDGIIDGDEVGGFEVVVNGIGRTVTTLAYAADSDGDGLQDGFEREQGLDPSRQDTDGDGVDDLSDVNPYHDVAISFRVGALHLSVGSEGPDPRSVVAFLQSPGETYRSAAVEVGRGQTVRGDGWDSQVLDVSDAGGNFLSGESNLTFALTFFTEEGGESDLVDLSSDTTSAGTIFGRKDAATGRPTLGAEGDQPWPSDGRFEGPDGWVEIEILLVEPPIDQVPS